MTLCASVLLALAVLQIAVADRFEGKDVCRENALNCADGDESLPASHDTDKFNEQSNFLFQSSVNGHAGIKQSLYNKLWNSNLDIAKETLKTDFLKRMDGNTLEAERYVIFMIQDLYYLVKVTHYINMIAMELSGSSEKELQTFFERRSNSYRKYTKYILDFYHITDISSIEPQTAIKDYVESFSELLTEHPIYFAIAMLPCAKLWPFVAENLNIKEGNPYYPFKRDNGDDNSRKHYEPLLKLYQDRLNQTKAFEIFRNQMKHEKSFFSSS
ncbi:uncharacterized protein [Heptranchias perlo]|uniref:uncharacterized protein n=1 Tax=Heptranchias perlo TaxID=212740 RepID=UPI0035599DD6